MYLNSQSSLARISSCVSVDKNQLINIHYPSYSYPLAGLVEDSGNACVCDAGWGPDISDVYYVNCGMPIGTPFIMGIILSITSTCIAVFLGFESMHLRALAKKMLMLAAMVSW